MYIYVDILQEMTHAEGTGTTYATPEDRMTQLPSRMESLTSFWASGTALETRTQWMDTIIYTYYI